MPQRHRYARWDGTQEILGPDADELFERLAEDVFHGWDFESALRRVLGQGFRDATGRRVPGLERLLEQVRRRRQRQLQRFNLDGLFADIRERLDNIIQQERRGVEARRQAGGGAADQRIRQRMAADRLAQLDRLPAEPGSAIQALQDYEFLDQRAARDFAALMQELRQQLVDAHLRDLGRSMAAMTAADVARLGQMVQELNQMLGDHLEGRPPQYQAFMERWGHLFPEHPATFDEFLAQLQAQMAQMESLLQSLDPDRRQQLEDLLTGVMADPGLRAALDQMAGLLAQLSPQGRLGSRYRFVGGEELSLPGAMSLMGELQGLEEVERALQQAYQGEPISGAVRQRLAELLGAEAARSLDQVQGLIQELEAAGHLRREEERLELTPRGVRRIGQKALGDIFRHLQAGRFGSHPTAAEGGGGDRTEETRPYQFGDPFDLHTARTLMHAVQRQGGRRPLALTPEDFEIYRSEQASRASTVLLLDMSRSMPLRGYFYAAKKVALALDTLIRTAYPRDHLGVIGFSDYAREIPPGLLAHLSYSEYALGTNMEHGLMLARRLLARHRGGTRQVIIVSDGEPTSHMEGSRASFHYPPQPETVHKTLAEVRRCTREGIVINTFMLESSPPLVQFVKQMTRLNRGRAFFISPDRLGDYVLVDYAASRSGPA